MGKKRTIQTKIIWLIVVGILAAELLTGSIGIYSFSRAMKRDSDHILNLTAGETAGELDALFGRIEQSVDVLAQYALNHIESTDRLISDREYLEDYTREIEAMGLTIANETAGTVGVYIRYNPDTMPTDSGFFQIRNLEEKDFHSIPVTDFSMYEEDDAEHVGWYYGPIKNGKPTWMLPYYNGNIDVFMISYVVPLYKDGETIGIIGMDIDFAYIADIVDEIEIYETGHVFLTNHKYEVLHSKIYEEGSPVVKEDVKIAYKTLRNNMCLGAAVPAEEISKEIEILIFRITMATLLIIILAVILTVGVMKNIIRPLKQLTVAAHEISNGNLDVKIETQSKDEVGVLAQSFKETAQELKQRIEYINNLAYLDVLTGMKNHTAYVQEQKDIREEQKENGYAVFVIDINGLKQVNDTFGHHCGNELLVEASKVIADVFDFSNTYRVGGDEFVAVLRHADEVACEQQKNAFYEKLAEANGKMQIYAAVGIALCKEGEKYEEVLRRADEQMYEQKQQMKKDGKISSIRQK